MPLKAPRRMGLVEFNVDGSDETVIDLVNYCHCSENNGLIRLHLVAAKLRLSSLPLSFTEVHE
jgi:hypothetical protein